MADVADAFAVFFRDFNEDGIPSSGLWEPDKADGRDLGPLLEEAILAAAAPIATFTRANPDVSALIQNSISKTATWSNGATTMTVTDVTGLRVGDTVRHASIPTHARITAINTGTKVVTFSDAAIAGATAVTVTFGMDRFNPLSTVAAGTIAVDNLYVGQAAKMGRSTWLNRVNYPGLDYPTVAKAVMLNDGGPTALCVGGRTSDNGGLWTLPFTVTFWNNDGSGNGDGWAAYFQSRLDNGAWAATSHHIQTEKSLQSYWPTVDIDPFDYNAPGATRIDRFDAGIGTFTLGQEAQPNNISAFIDFVFNDARARAGIIFGHDSLDIASGRVAPAIAMAPRHALDWYGAIGDVAWRIFSDATSGNSALWLRSDMALFNADLGITKPNGVAAVLNFQEAYSERWQIGRASTGDFVISRFNSSAVFQDLPLTIRAGDGVVILPNMPILADNAAAISAGLPVGALYRKTGATQTVCVRE